MKIKVEIPERYSSHIIPAMLEVMESEKCRMDIYAKERLDNGNYYVIFEVPNLQLYTQVLLKTTEYYLMKKMRTFTSCGN